MVGAMRFFVVLLALAVGHNCALNGGHVVDIGDEGHAGPVVGEVALPGGIALDKDDGAQSVGLSGEAESADAGEEVNVGAVIVHGSVKFLPPVRRQAAARTPAHQYYGMATAWWCPGPTGKGVS
jgi:hypothetical protein